MKTTFICPDRPNFGTSVTINGKCHFIDFSPKIIGNTRQGVFYTSNEAVIEALKNDSGFNKIWFEKEEIEETENPDLGEKTETTKVPAEEVSNFQAAKKYLIEHELCTSGDLTDGKSVLKIAQENNLEFLGWSLKTQEPK